MSDDLTRTAVEEGALPAGKQVIFAGPYECVVDEELLPSRPITGSLRGSHFVIRDLVWTSCVLGLNAVPEGVATFDVVSGGGNTDWYWKHVDSRRRTARIRLTGFMKSPQS